MSEFIERAQKLHDDIAQTRQTLRDEHFPYEGSTGVYAALHEVLRQLADIAVSFVRWAEHFPGKEPDITAWLRFHTAELIHDGIKKELG